MFEALEALAVGMEGETAPLACVAGFVAGLGPAEPPSASPNAWPRVVTNGGGGGAAGCGACAEPGGVSATKVYSELLRKLDSPIGVIAPPKPIPNPTPAAALLPPSPPPPSALLLVPVDRLTACCCCC